MKKKKNDYLCVVTGEVKLLLPNCCPGFWFGDLPLPDSVGNLLRSQNLGRAGGRAEFRNAGGPVFARELP